MAAWEDRRRAFTLIELLVVICDHRDSDRAAAGPPVQQAREAASPDAVQEQPEAVGALSLFNYESTYNTFPIGYLDTVPGRRHESGRAAGHGPHRSCPTSIRRRLYNTLTFSTHPYGSVSTAANRTAMQAIQPAMRCPSDIGPTQKKRQLRQRPRATASPTTR